MPIRFLHVPLRTGAVALSHLGGVGLDLMAHALIRFAVTSHQPE